MHSNDRGMLERMAHEGRDHLTIDPSGVARFKKTGSPEEHLERLRKVLATAAPEQANVSLFVLEARSTSPLIKPPTGHPPDPPSRPTVRSNLPAPEIVPIHLPLRRRDTSALPARSTLPTPPCSGGTPNSSPQRAQIRARSSSKARSTHQTHGADLTSREADPDWRAALCRDGFRFTAPVGSFRSNAFGLYDMHGNVWEWVADCQSISLAHVSKPETSPIPACVSDTPRILRGGSWSDPPQRLRSAARVAGPPDARDSIVGFRVARTLQPGP